VNSGVPREKVAGYLQKHGITWPTIVDPDRSFEKSLQMKPISLQNIWQFRALDAEGQWQAFSADLETKANQLLETASWNVDPTTIPENLRAEWFAVEFGNYAAVARSLQKAALSRKEEQAAAAKALLDHVFAEFEERSTDAAALADDGKTWEAFKAYRNIEWQFDNYDVDVSEAMKGLRSDANVKKELAGEEALATAQRIIARSGLGQAKRRLGAVIEDHPDTEAAATAKEFLEGIE
jgi:hypothetical protein